MQVEKVPKHIHQMVVKNGDEITKKVKQKITKKNKSKSTI